MGREYIPTFFLYGVIIAGFLWHKFYADPILRRAAEEERKKRATAAPESHSKSSE